MSAFRIAKYVRHVTIVGIAVMVGLFVSIRMDDSRRHSVLLDFDTQTASADAPGTSDGSGTGSSDGGSDGGGSGDSGSGDCGL
jgi:uncharacterized membrane protein YgcG